MSNDTKPIEALEQRVKQLEHTVHDIRDVAKKLKENLRLLERLKDVPQQIETWENRIADLEKQSAELDKKIDTTAIEVRAAAEAAAQGLVDALGTVLETRIGALETATETTIPHSIQAEAAQARAAAEATAQGLVDALSKNGGALFNLAAEHDTLAAIVDEIKNPTPATNIATVRVEEYRKFSTGGQLDELKKALSDDQLEVLREIASRLDPQKDEDSKLLSNMFTLVNDDVRMVELVSFAGSKVEPSSASVSGGIRNGR